MDCFDQHGQYVLSQLENDLQKVIFLDWFNRGHLWQYNTETRTHDRTIRYQHVDHDWEMAYGYIMETISNGMG